MEKTVHEALKSNPNGYVTKGVCIYVCVGVCVTVCVHVRRVCMCAYVYVVCVYVYTYMATKLHMVTGGTNTA